MQADKASRDPKAAFVAELKAAREFNKISLKEIGAETMVSLRYLQNLENGDWQEIPRPYLRGYLINYAECVGMNLERVLRSFDELDWQGESPSQIADRSGPVTRPAGSGQDGPLVPPLITLIPLRKKITLALLGTILVLVVAWVVWLFNHESAQESVGDGDFRRTIESARQDDAQARLLLQELEPRQLSLRLQRPGRLRLSAGDSLVFEGEWPADSLYRFRSTAELSLQAERAEDLELSWDGETLDLGAHSGAVLIQLSQRGLKVRPLGQD